MTYTVEIHRFKDTGKYYDTIIREVNLQYYVGDDPNSIILDKLRDEQNKDEFIWLLTGKGMPFDVPRLLKRWHQ